MYRRDDQDNARRNVAVGPIGPSGYEIEPQFLPRDVATAAPPLHHRHHNRHSGWSHEFPAPVQGNGREFPEPI